MDTYERKQSLMTRDEIQRDIDMIRLAYRNRNHVNGQPHPVAVFFTYLASLLIVAGIIALIAKHWN